MTIQILSEHACFGGVQRFCQHASAEIGLPMKFSVYLPPQALAGARVPALLLPGRPDLHRRNFHDEGRGAAPGRRAGPGPDRARHQPARRQCAGRSRQLGLWRGRRLLPGRNRRALGPALAHGKLAGSRAAAVAPCAAACGLAKRGHLRPLHGRAWRAHAGAAPPGGVQDAVGLCAHLRAHAVPLGPQGAQRLPGRDTAAWKAHDATELMAQQTTAPYPAAS
jgi:S-formylglutathione hydrolase